MKHVFVHVLTLIGRRLKTGVRTSKLLKRLVERWDTNPLSGSHTTKRKTHKTWFSFHFEILVHMWKCQEVSLWKLWPARDKTIITCEKQCENILFACNIVYKVWTQLITRENHRHTFVLMIFSCKYMNVFDSLVKGKWSLSHIQTDTQRVKKEKLNVFCNPRENKLITCECMKFTCWLFNSHVCYSAHMWNYDFLACEGKI